MIIEATAWEESEQECRATNTYIPDNNKFIEEANYDTSNAETNGITIPFIWGRWVPRQMGTRVFRVCFTLMNQSTFFQILIHSSHICTSNSGPAHFFTLSLTNLWLSWSFWRRWLQMRDHRVYVMSVEIG